MLLGNIGEPKTMAITRISKNVSEFIRKQKKYDAELKNKSLRLKNNNGSIVMNIVSMAIVYIFITVI